MFRISDLANLGLQNIAPNSNDTDLQVLTASIVNTRDEEGKPTATVDYVSLICLGHGTGQPSIKILQPSADIVNRVRDLQTKLQTGTYIRASFEDLTVKPYIIFKSGNSGVSCKATDFSITVEKNLTTEDEVIDLDL